MSKTKLVAISILLIVLMTLLSSFTTTARPNVSFYFYAPEGMNPGSKILVHLELTQMLDNKLSIVFTRIVAIPIYVEDASDTDYIGLFLLNETEKSVSIYYDALKQYAFNRVIIQSTDTYGYIIKPSFREHGVYSGNITLTIPQGASCGDTILLYFHVRVDDQDYDILEPIGIVCDAFRVGIYTEKQVENLQQQIQNLKLENTDLSNKLANESNLLNKCLSEKTQLNNTLQGLNNTLLEKEKIISSYVTQVEELKNQVSQQMSVIYVLAFLLASTYIALILIYIMRHLKKSQ
ncbi:MAG: hypothetical protein JHC26_08900 [Thermofilum sp.]|jgi:hypothetical protein|uniref:hypothetical protein n=1 Tax=Thermofilum sp. TaxID=1961369 RepID=UPI0025887BAE|nr:hypothetical protein [Thermofilum sp.]MCI4409196.1 hypothetical protein [Thermofilum sp.]